MYKVFSFKTLNQVWGLMTIVLELGMLKEEDCHKLKASLAYILGARLSLTRGRPFHK